MFGRSTHPRMLPLMLACALAGCGGGGGGESSATPGGNAGTVAPDPALVQPHMVSPLPYNVAVPTGTVLRVVAGFSFERYDQVVPDSFRYGWTVGGVAIDTPGFEWVATTPGSLTVDLKVTDAGGHVRAAASDALSVRSVQVDPVIVSLGGAGMRDGGPLARFNQPVGLLPATDGGMLVLDQGNSVIRKIGKDGVVSTVAGVPTLGGDQLGKNGVARLGAPLSFTRDAAGNLYVADVYRLLKVSPQGAITAVPGGLYAGRLADTAPGVSWTRVIAATPNGDLYVASRNTVRLLKGGTATLLSGSLDVFDNVDGAQADARFTDIRAMVVGPDGELWIQDGCTRLRRLSRDGRVDTVARTPDAVYPGRCGTGLAVAPGGGVYLATASDVTLVKPDGSMQTVLGHGGVDAVAVDADGTLHTALTDDHTVTRHVIGAPYTFGLSPKERSSFPSPFQDLASFGEVRSFGVHPSGDLYFIDNARLCRVASPSGDVGCVAGRKDSTDPVDGSPIVARLSTWQDAEVTIDRAGQVYFSDFQTLRRYTPSTGEIATIAGDPRTMGAIEDADGAGAAAAFRRPRSLTTDSKGNVYAIANQNRVLRITPAGVVTTLVRYSDGNWNLDRLAVGTDDQLYAMNNLGIFKVVEGSALTRVDWPKNPRLLPGFSGGAVVTGPDGAFWILNTVADTRDLAWLERATLTERRDVLWFGPVRRQVVVGMPEHEFDLKFRAVGIDAQGRLVMSERGRFGFWRLSEPVSAGL
ncbi:hypothetical protein [Roseateles amylovorans]|uniref:NHL repeat-containing protein n=1 Tax=Roseateles amylovorans TaxID=2978473 RepID=A0ABY6B4J6_9BURK|nr:hypothetical protein [Roseateles amylovorans]UXH78874.1 hypothetical protein N4261_02730 [Roseateles amylovorans]